MTTLSKKKFFISPLFAGIISYSIFFIAFIFPPDYYQKLIREKDFVYLDPASFLLVTICIFFFFIGLLITNSSKKNFSQSEPTKFILPIFLYLIIPILISIICSLISINLLLNKNPLIIFYLSMGDGNEIKRNIDLSNTMAQASQFSISIVLWTTVNYLNLKNRLNRLSKFLIFLLIIALSLICIANSTLKMARFEMIPLLLGFTVIFINHKYNYLSDGQIVKYLVLAFLIVIFIFGLFSFLRGSDSFDDIIQMIVGYTLTSYNHMAAILDGKLKYLDPGYGYYLLIFLSYLPLMGDSFTYNFLGWPHTEYIRSQEFIDTYSAALNGNYIWLTIFGYVWVSVKMFTPIVMFFYGIIVQKAWNSFKRGSPFGIIFYPWLFFCIFFWLGSNILVQSHTISVLSAYFFILFYDFLFIRK